MHAEKCTLSLPSCLTQRHQPSIVIYLTPVNVSVFHGLPPLPFYFSLPLPQTISFNHHLPSLLSLSLPIYLSLIYRKPFLSISLPLSLSQVIFLCYITASPHPRLLLPLSFSASHPGPGVFLGDQSSSSQRCHAIGSSPNTHVRTHICYNEWTTNAKIYIWLQ